VLDAETRSARRLNGGHFFINAQFRPGGANVAVGSKADMTTGPRDVRFTLIATGQQTSQFV